MTSKAHYRRLNINKIIICLLMICLLSNCSKKDKNAQKIDNKDNKIESIQNVQEPEEILDDNTYYLNIPGNMWLQDQLGGTEGRRYRTSLHKSKVIVLEEKDGWKKIKFPDFPSSSTYWIEDRYFVKSLREIVPDYEFIKKAVGKYYYDRIEIVKNDNDGKIPYLYDGTVITLDYKDGGKFSKSEINGDGSFSNQQECNVPNNNIDPFIVDEVIGKRDDYYVQYYFTDNGIKIRNEDRDTGLIYDVIYIKK